MRTRSEGTSEWVRGTVAGLVMVLALATVSAAQEKPAATQSTAASEPTTAAKAEEQPKGGMGEGIKVHGHWTIDIKNPAGSLASHNEFENALNGGEPALAAMLGRRFLDLSWGVLLTGGLSSLGPSCDSSGQSGACTIVEPSYPFAQAYYSKNLQLVVPTDVSGVPTGMFQLTGSATMFRDSSIARVSTILGGNVTTGQGTTVLAGFNFTAKDLSPAIPVAAGQIIQVTVVISFS